MIDEAEVNTNVTTFYGSGSWRFRKK